MAQVPQYNRQVQAQLTPAPYKKLDINQDMFGVNVSQAMNNAGSSLGNAGNALAELARKREETKLFELKNADSEWRQENLLDKEKGYYYKFGKDAYGQSETILKNYDEFMTKKIQDAKLSPFAARQAKDVYMRLRENVKEGVTSHDFKQGIAWSNTEAETAKISYLEDAESYRNDEQKISNALLSGYQTIEWQGELQHQDDAGIRLQKIQFRSQLHETVLNGLLNDGSLKAGEYFEAHKNEILPDKQDKYAKAVRDEEIRYKARETAQSILGLDTQTAYGFIDSIENIDERNATESEYNRLLRHQETVQDENDRKISDEIMQKVYLAFDNGEDISSIMREVNTSDMSLEQKEKIYKNLKAMQELAGAGNNWADYNILLDTAAFNNEEFKNINPANYNLTKEQYNKITEMQRKAANNEYTPEAEIKKAIKGMYNPSFNIQGGNGLLSKEYEDEVVRFLSKVERMQGKAFDLNNDAQLQAIMKGFDYKDPDGVNKNIDETKELFARAKKHGEVYDLMAREYMMFKGQNKREPSPSEIFEMAKRSYNTIENEWKQRDLGKLTYAQGIYQSVNAVKAKKGETKVLTYYADVRIPQISRELGIPLQVTSRYRAGDPGGHGKGIKCDVGMTALNVIQRRTVFEIMLSDPAVASIGTSDPDLLKKYNNPKNPKIRDLRGYDEDYKKAHPNTTMNHVNHMDILFDTRYGGDEQGR